MAYATTHRQLAGRMPAPPARKMGTWKMAYADFLTALMAFFLLMWMVSGVSPDARAAIAAEFKTKETALASATPRCRYRSRRPVQPSATFRKP
jgi:chemotaxis protein MotB